MDTKTIREELARQDAQLEAALKSLDKMGSAGIAIPDEALRALRDPHRHTHDNQPPRHQGLKEHDHDPDHESLLLTTRPP